MEHYSFGHHWSNEETLKEYIEAVIFLYIRKVKEGLQLKGALLIFVNLKVQCTSTILTQLDSHNVNVALIPANCSNRLQPLDLSINNLQKIFFVSNLKAGMQKKFAHN